MQQNSLTKPFLSSDTNPDLICFSHLRWNFVYQRPQHLMSRAAKKARVIYFQEPVYTRFPDKLHIEVDPASQVVVVTPDLEESLSDPANVKRSFNQRMARLVDQLVELYKISDFVSWYYTPMALAYTGHLRPTAVVYDCMDELSAFRFAPPDLISLEKELFSRADL